MSERTSELRRSPYQHAGPIHDPRLLEFRRGEIETALEAIAPSNGSPQEHVLVLGEPRSGRTSTVREIARRAADERDQLVVHLRPTAAQLAEGSPAVIRHLLIAAVEAVAEASGDASREWHQAWKDRVFMRDTSSSTKRDRLVSALAFASDPVAPLDPVLLERDLRVLGELARATGAAGILVVLDDASDVTADTVLLEELLASVDHAGGWALLLAALPASIRHFTEAVSPCLRRFWPIHLQPLGLRDVFACLTAPLDPEDRERYVKPLDVSLARDVVRLTNGSPYEVMLVADRMWQACDIGETEHFSLTPRVLDRVVHDLALLASGDDLLDGAMAIRRLPREQIASALELVSFTGLTINEIAVARALGVTSRDVVSVRQSVSDEDVEREAERVRDAIGVMEEAGIVMLSSDGQRFTVVGGRAAYVLLKYEARAAHGPKVTDRPFGLDFSRVVGRALLRNILTHAGKALGETATLGVDAVELKPTAISRRSPRAAAKELANSRSITPIARGDLALVPYTKLDIDRAVEALKDPSSLTLALVSASGAYGDEPFEYTELWQLPAGADQEELTRLLAEAVDATMPAFELSGARWSGTEGWVLGDSLARETLVAAHPTIASVAVGEIFAEYMKDRSIETLARATNLALSYSAILQSAPFDRIYRELFLSPLLSRAGFLLAFDRERLDEARETLVNALEIGSGEGWVTHWNLANVAAQQDDANAALNGLSRAAEASGTRDVRASVLLFLPDVPASDTLIDITTYALPLVLNLQEAVIKFALQGADDSALTVALAACFDSKHTGAIEAAQLVISAFELVEADQDASG